jgi:hypothetical protein
MCLSLLHLLSSTSKLIISNFIRRFFTSVILADFIEAEGPPTAIEVWL